MQYPGNVAERKTTPCNKGHIANACLWPFALSIEAAALLMAMGSKYPLHLSTSFYHKNPVYNIHDDQGVGHNGSSVASELEDSAPLIPKNVT